MTKDVWYHSTKPENLNSILRLGLLTNQVANHSIGSLVYMKDIYGVIPIYLSRDPYKYNTSRREVTVEIHNLKKEEIFADIPTIISSHGGILSEDVLYFEEGEVPPEINYIENPNDSRFSQGEISFDDLIKNRTIINDLIKVTRTAASIKSIEPENIRIYFTPNTEYKILL
jgi:hypothetical protein